MRQTLACVVVVFAIAFLSSSSRAEPIKTYTTGLGFERGSTPRSRQIGAQVSGNKQEISRVLRLAKGTQAHKVFQHFEQGFPLFPGSPVVRDANENLSYVHEDRTKAGTPVFKEMKFRRGPTGLAFEAWSGEGGAHAKHLKGRVSADGKTLKVMTTDDDAGLKETLLINIKSHGWLGFGQRFDIQRQTSPIMK